MKGEIKKKYQEYINHIDFPAMLYVYETNKIIAINEYATNILGNVCDDIRDIFKGKRHRLSKELLEGNSDLITNVLVYSSEGEELYVDTDVNVIMIDNIHLVLMLFEESSKKIFTGNIQIQVPRVCWKYENYVKIHVNMSLANDIKDMKLSEDNRYILDENISRKMNKLKNEIIDTGQSVYNSIQMITKGQNENRFIKLSLMPIVDFKGKCIGILSIHNRILKKAEQRNLYNGVSTNEEDAYNIYKSILDNIGNDILVCLNNNKIGYINSAIENNYEGNILGMDIFEFFNKYKFLNAKVHEHKEMSKLINEGFNSDKVNQVLMYDGFNNRYISIKIQKIKWKDNSYALLFSFNDNYREIILDMGERCIIKK